jgi:ADP-ribose pyrophosphatase YjhB (NUDIX family)
MYTDSLYRISLKCFITSPEGNVLVVRETGRGSWDLPGGGIDHGEDIRSAIARELNEEIAYQGNFTYEVMRIDDPFKLRTRDVWQMKIVYKVTLLDSNNIGIGKDADEVAFIDPMSLKNSIHLPEKAIYEYTKDA